MHLSLYDDLKKSCTFLSMIVKNPKVRPWMLKKEIIVLYYGLKDQRTSAIARLPVIVAIIYLLNPFDLIPDFIPFFGYVDDLIIVPLLLNLAIRLLPRPVREESLLKATAHHKKIQWLVFLIIFLFISLLFGILFLIWHFMNR
jgi:uncharacterized membrane protein YkvA (DUF1232 family)